MAEMVSTSPPQLDEGETRRDFLLIATSAVGVVGTALAAWPFIDSMNPAADTLALASTGVDLAPVEVGQRITVVWRGKPVFIDHRPAQEIQAAEAVPLSELVDPQPDSARVQKPEWLVVVGVCMEPDTIYPLLGISKELNLQFVLGYTPDEFAATLRHIAEGAIPTAPLITGKVGIEGVAGAFEALATPERHAKILVEPWRA